MSDYISLSFTGPNARFHLTDPEGWVMRESYLLRAAREHGLGPGDLPTHRSMIGKTDLTGPVAFHPGGPGRGKKGVVVNPGAYCACGEPIARSEVNKNYTRCRSCRARRREAIRSPFVKANS